MRTLVWFRSDLRVQDNTALLEACNASDDGVVAVFVVCPDQWAQYDLAPIKVDFLLRNLADLARSLRELAIPLRILHEPRFDGVAKQLLALAHQHRCGGIWFNEEYEVNEQRRDDDVRRTFEGAGLAAHAFVDQTILSPYDVETGQGTFYSVFTPFKKKWLAAVEESGGVHVGPRPPAQRPLDIESDPVPTTVTGFDGQWDSAVDRWPGGEASAHSRLRTFVEQRIEAYHSQRDLPAVNGTSTLSPYLASGILSPRQCFLAGRTEDPAEGPATWISELIWREFYRHVLVGFPRVCRGQPFNLRTRHIEWRESESDFERWANGMTGIPIVDAGMRQLRATGWMHNRLRMITAMFLTKNLFLDWRLGERHFIRHLIDGDVASNNGGWQWSASLGTDAAPYFRVFNPVSQSERFDPDGTFIRSFVPELAPELAPQLSPELSNVKGRAIHLPGERDADACKSSGYPMPMVDLKASRQRAITTFKDELACSRS